MAVSIPISIGPTTPILDLQQLIMPWPTLRTLFGVRNPRIGRWNTLCARKSSSVGRRGTRRDVHSCQSTSADKARMLPFPGQQPRRSPPRTQHPQIGWELTRQEIDKHREIQTPPPAGWVDRTSLIGGSVSGQSASGIKIPWSATPPAPGTVFRSLVPARKAQRYTWFMGHLPGLAAGHSAPEAAWRTRLMMAVCRATKDYEDSIPLGMTATYLRCPSAVDREGRTFAYPSMKAWAQETAAKPAFTQWPQTLVTESGEWKVRISSPPAQWWIKRAAGVTHSSPLTDNTFNGRISLKHIFYIAQQKLQDLDPPPRLPRGYPDQCDDTLQSQHECDHYLSEPPISPPGVPATSEADEYDELMRAMCGLLCQMARRMGINVVI